MAAAAVHRAAVFIVGARVEWRLSLFLFGRPLERRHHRRRRRCRHRSYNK